MRTKVTVIGTGEVGATCAQRIAERDYAEVVLLDVVEGRAAGAALDIAHAGPLLGYEPRVAGTTAYEDTAGSEIVVIAAGVARRPGVDERELLERNGATVRDAAARVAERSPDAIVIVVTEPLGAMAHVVAETTLFPRERLLGMGPLVDSARFRALLAQELGASAHDVDALVLGGRGDAAVPVVSGATVAGAPVAGLLDAGRLDRVVARTRAGGGEIARLLGSSPAAAPSAGVLALVDAVVLDQRRVLPCAVLCRGEYRLDGVFAGVPARLGGEGIEEIVELPLAEEERRALARAAAAVREQVDALARV